MLELGVEEGAREHLLDSILHEWPAYLAYFTSFLTIGVIWLEHAAITQALRAADATLYRLNLLVLLLASFLPFPTKLVSEFFGDTEPERVAAVVYGLTLLGLTTAMTVMIRYAAENRRLVKDELDAKTVEKAATHAPNFALYLIGIGISLVAPTIGVAAYLASAVYRGLPARTLRRLLFLK